VLASNSITSQENLTLVLLYTTSLDITALQYKNTALWVDLVELHPILEAEANSMLAEIGPVIYSTLHTTQSRFQNVCGCVLVDLTKDLKTGLVLPTSIDDGRSVYVPIAYQNLPKNCQICGYKGHLPRMCPNLIPILERVPLPHHLIQHTCTTLILVHLQWTQWVNSRKFVEVRASGPLHHL
jgi:hypothetical protein